MRERIRDTIESIVDEELKAAVGAGRSERVGLVRAGYWSYRICPIRKLVVASSGPD
jgi:hypothetical protein